MMWKILILALVFRSLGCGDDDGRTALHLAAMAAYGNYGDAAETAVVLLKAGANVHAKNNGGATPLHVAAYGNAPETVGLAQGRCQRQRQRQ